MVVHVVASDIVACCHVVVDLLIPLELLMLENIWGMAVSVGLEYKVIICYWENLQLIWLMS